MPFDLQDARRIVPSRQRLVALQGQIRVGTTSQLEHLFIGFNTGETVAVPGQTVDRWYEFRYPQ